MSAENKSAYEISLHTSLHPSLNKLKKTLRISSYYENVRRWPDATPQLFRRERWMSAVNATAAEHLLPVLGHDIESEFQTLRT